MQYRCPNPQNSLHNNTSISIRPKRNTAEKNPLIIILIISRCLDCNNLSISQQRTCDEFAVMSSFVWRFNCIYHYNVEYNHRMSVHNKDSAIKTDTTVAVILYYSHNYIYSLLAGHINGFLLHDISSTCIGYRYHSRMWRDISQAS